MAKTTESQEANSTESGRRSSTLIIGSSWKVFWKKMIEHVTGEKL
ncbi:MAG TPA: hypothetical protein PLK90_01265 [Clostridiales bacterium]|nr:hypothetical protein [Clostridiales bacterium]HQP69006.1 hypothetical protein [Clostridiales bacterium]